MRKVAIVLISLLLVSCSVKPTATYKNHKYKCVDLEKGIFIGEDGKEYVLAFNKGKFYMKKK